MKKFNINKIAVYTIAFVFVGQIGLVSSASAVTDARAGGVPRSSSDPGGDNYAAEQAKKRAAQAAAKKAAAAKRAAEVKAAVDAALAKQRERDAARGGGSGGGDRDDTITIQPTSAGAGASSDDKEAQAKVNKVEKGNVVVVTYVDDPKIDKKGNKDHRLGGVDVKVERVDGDMKCANRKKTAARTNGKSEMKDKDGKVIKDSKGNPVPFKGTVNYRMCNAGKYKATVIGRDGYTPVGKKTIEFNLKNDEIQTVKFVLKKNAKTTKKKKTAVNVVSPMVASRIF